MKKEKQFTMVYVEDVKQYGLIRATILGKIKGWCETNKKAKRYEYDGFYWSGHITIDEMVELTGLPLETIKKNLKWLLDNNVVIKGNYNTNKYDRTGWYRPNPSIPTGIIQHSSQEHSYLPDRNNGKGMTGTMEEVLEEQTIPNIPTNIQTNIPKPTIPTNIPETNIPSVEDRLKEKASIADKLKTIFKYTDVIKHIDRNDLDSVQRRNPQVFNQYYELILNYQSIKI
jgi:hypothetical protein